MSKEIFIGKLYLIIILFTPSFFGYMALQNGQKIYLLIYFIFSIFFSMFYLKNKIYNILFPIAISFFISFHYSISTIINYENNINFSDFYEVARPIIYCLSLLFSIIILGPFVKKIGVWECLKFIENIIFFYSFFEFLKFINFTKYYFYLFTPFSYNSTNYIRFFGTTGFAYNYAWLLMVCIIFNAIRTEGKIGFRFIYFSFLVILTGSRSGIFTLFVLYFLLFVYIKKIRIRLLFEFIIAFLIGFILYGIKIPVITRSVNLFIRLINAFLGLDDDGSLMARQVQIELSLLRFNQNPIFGTASDKEKFDTIENFYFHHMAAWGSIGIIIIIIWYFSFNYLLPTRTTKILYFLILVISLIISFSTPLLDQVRIFNVFFAIIAILVTNRQEEKHVYIVN
jgi:hypothetical protein